MALTSPGVEVTVIDESFYTPAEPGTVPLIVVATAQDKRNGAGTATASGTTKANAGKALKMTSQKDLLDTFGVPFFEKTASSTPIHGSERNEYGLLAAYSLLGVSNAAFIVRADVDLSQLEGQAAAPGAEPTNGQWWIDTTTSTWGIQEWNGAAISTTGGQKFASKSPIVLTDSDDSKVTSGVPKTSVGAIGDYAVVIQTVDGAPSGTFDADREIASMWFKSPGNTAAGVAAGSWVAVGSNDWALSWVTVQGTTAGTLTAGQTFIINGTTVAIPNSPNNTVDGVVDAINDLGIGAVSEELVGIVAKNDNGKIYLYTNAANDLTGDSVRSNAIIIAPGTATLSTLGLTSGTFYGPALQQTPHTQVPEWKTGDTYRRPSGSVWVKTTSAGGGARWKINRYNSATTSWVSFDAPLYVTTNAALYYLDRSGGGANLSVDSLFVQTNALEHTLYDDTPPLAEFRVWRRAGSGATTIASNAVKSGTFTSGANTFTIAESLKGQIALDTAKSVSFTAAGNMTDAELMAAAINAAGFTNIVAEVAKLSETANELRISHKLGGDFRITDGTRTPFASAFTPFSIDSSEGTAKFYSLANTDAAEDFLASNWQPLAASNFKASSDAPMNEPTDGQLWYNPEFSDVDMMIHNGTTWVGYRNTGSLYPESSTSTRTGYTPIVAASNPFVQGTTATGDLWISTADLENYPTIYKYNSLLTDLPADSRWVIVDKTDQITEEGILFADARWNTDGLTTTAATINDLADSNFLDFDAPDPALYPKGMLLWNLRRSGGNVKKYMNGYVDTTKDNPRMNDAPMTDYATDRWITASPNKEDGSGSFGRHAQRVVVTQALKSVVDTSQEIRDEERRNFNLIAAPGYPELLSNLVNLNIDRGITAFVVGDSPLRLASDATTLTNWGSNANLVTDNGDDGLVTYDEYAAVFYPSGFTTDLGGSNAVVPSSHMMLKTIALSDNASYPWFAPAGTRRGGITNATSVGYIDAASGEFQVVALNEGQRDTLYDLKVNPITFFNGVGLVNYGQKTRARNASALDRINVARLVVYLRSQLNKLARPYIFEPNDKITRDEVKQAVESLLLELVGLRALYDFAVVCDDSNNTPTRIDRNELWVDIAIEPVKAVEFIYIPLRVKNTGEI